jgi:hypothetical protein
MRGIDTSKFLTHDSVNAVNRRLPTKLDHVPVVSQPGAENAKSPKQVLGERLLNYSYLLASISGCDTSELHIALARS